MSDPTTEEVLRLAQQRLAERRTAEATGSGATRETRDRPWRVAALAVFGVLLAALLFSPGAPLEWKMYAVVHGVCAQQHNIFLGGLQFPLCARNSGIYMSFLLTLAYLWLTGRQRAGRLPAWPVTAALVALVGVMAVDGFNSLFVDLGLNSLYTPDNRLRTLTGMGMGIAIGTILHLVLNVALRKDIDREQRVLGWRDLAAIMVINLLVLAAIYGNLWLMFWPLATIAFLGITGVLYLVSLLVTSLIMGYENAVTSPTQLARPAVVALVPTMLMLGSMSVLRFWMEGQGILL